MYMPTGEEVLQAKYKSEFDYDSGFRPWEVKFTYDFFRLPGSIYIPYVPAQHQGLLYEPYRRLSKKNA